MIQFKSDRLLELSNLELGKFKGHNVSIQTKSCLYRGIISGFLVDNINFSYAKIIGFILGIDTVVRFNDIDLMDIIDDGV